MVASFERYGELTEAEQMRFKGSAKSFTRLQVFLPRILRYSNVGWGEFAVFVNFLIPRLPVPKEEDLYKGMLEAVDMDIYWCEKRATVRIAMEDGGTEIDPI